MIHHGCGLLCEAVEQCVECCDALFPSGSGAQCSGTQGGAVSHNAAEQCGEAVDILVMDVVEARRSGDVEQCCAGWADRDDGNACREVVVDLCRDAGLGGAGVVCGDECGVGLVESFVEFSA
ncbi:MAG: hypothetical protein ACRDSR_10250 [Pseudonocardiaceae bacterium]